MNTSSNVSSTPFNSDATTERSAAQPASEPSAPLPANSFDQWIQNGVDRFNDQTNPFPKVF